MSHLKKRTIVLGVVFITMLFIFQKNTVPPVAQQSPAGIIKKQEPQKPEAGAYYSVVKVVDGDTISIDMEDTVVKVRLIGLDTPETVDPRKPVQCFGIEASNKAKNVLTGQKVKIETDSSQGMRDKYGRLLAYIFLPDGTLFNKMMIEEGYGHEYTYHFPYRHQNEFKAAERKARELKVGLWADGVCGGTI